MCLDDRLNSQNLSVDPMLVEESIQRGATNLQLMRDPTQVTLVDCQNMHDEVRLEPVPGLFKGYGRRGLFLVWRGKIQVFGGEVWSLRHHYRPPNLVGEFPYVTRPRVDLDGLDRLPVKTANGLPYLIDYPIQHHMGYEQDILPAVSERR